MLLGVTTKTIRRWGKGGKMRVVRTIGGRRIPESEIKRILGLREERVVVGYVRVFSTTHKDDLRGRRILCTATLKTRGMAGCKY